MLLKLGHDIAIATQGRSQGRGRRGGGLAAPLTTQHIFLLIIYYYKKYMTNILTIYIYLLCDTLIN